MDVNQLMAAAEASTTALDVEQAAKFYFQARAQVTEVPVRLQILETLGECHVSWGNERCSTILSSSPPSLGRTNDGGKQWYTSLS